MAIALAEKIEDAVLRAFEDERSAREALRQIVVGPSDDRQVILVWTVDEWDEYGMQEPEGAVARISNAAWFDALDAVETRSTIETGGSKAGVLFDRYESSVRPPPLSHPDPAVNAAIAAQEAALRAQVQEALRLVAQRARLGALEARVIGLFEKNLGRSSSPELVAFYHPLGLGPLLPLMEKVPPHTLVYPFASLHPDGIALFYPESDGDALEDRPSGQGSGVITDHRFDAMRGLQIAVGDNLLSSFADTITDFNKVFAELQIIPTTAGFVKSFGEKDAAGHNRHAFALGALVPAYKSVDIDTKSAPDAAGRVQTYRRSSLDRTLVGQAAYALRFDERWRFGATLGFEYRHLSDREETEASSPATPAGNARFARGDSALSITTVALVLSVGALVSLPEGFSAGVSLSLPSVPVWGSAVARVSRSLADGEPPRTELIEDKAENLDAKSGGGASLRFGVAKVFSPGVEPTIASADLSLYGPRHYALLSLPGGDRPVRRSLTITTDVERRWVANLNLGVEHWLSPDWTVSGGLFTNFSSAPSIDDPEGKVRAADALPDVDTFGGTFALGWLGAHTLTTMGLEVSYGTGKDVIADDQRLRPFGTEQFRVVRIRELSVFVFLSSTLMF